ncbi:DUF5305 family protein [Thermococcus sibiricus]|uniref:DUF5305 domain-containing protein n=2 Tax=Thermococcus sibiricus TaxID=172049 RepID=C6A3V6_THESM|nr:DUF5305 family protein [Thermococcus sibiricus]ACS90301.1 hypothetical protein TSIB_1247 [Thermococcus sibiricus MM 739]KUK17550.1 MAG: Uncharacterized protein XD54_1143 [Thermococcus sibiricus]KUK28620.1 MAG: Uncharacterized protein XD61_0841 [Thermococcus sp. 40_45]
MDIKSMINVENLKKLVTRREVLAISLVLFLFFAFYSVKLLGVSSTVTTQNVLGKYTQEGELIHVAILQNNTLYGESLRRAEYPIPLVERFVLTYSYRFTPMTEIKGTYRTWGIVKYSVNRGSEEIVLWEDMLFKDSGELKDGKFITEYNLNLTELDRRTAEIMDQLGLKRLNREIVFTTNVHVEGKAFGKEINENFGHVSTLIKDTGSGLYYFTNEKESVQKSIIERQAQRTRVSKYGVTMYADTAKKVIPLLALLFLTPVIGGVYTIKSQRPKNEFKDLAPYITEGAPVEVEKRVILATKDDLKKTFDLLDKPILHYTEGGEDIYVIIDGGIAYEYRHKKSN